MTTKPIGLEDIAGISSDEGELDDVKSDNRMGFGSEAEFKEAICRVLTRISEIANQAQDCHTARKESANHDHDRDTNRP